MLSLAPNASGVGMRVWLNKPQGEVPEGGWPVLIVLDGESYFTPAAEMMQRLSKRTAKTRIVPMMVVGIAPAELQDRVATYAFTQGEKVSAPLGAQMLDRLVNEVVPLLKGHGADTGQITLAGHSMSGLFALEVAAKSDRFARYAVLSPSLWFNPAIADELAPNALAPTDNERLMLAVGELEEGADAAPSQLARRMVTNLTELGDRLNVPVEVCAGEDHGSVVFSLLPKVLRFASR